MKKTAGKPQRPEDQLAYFFYRNGCLRLPNQSRRDEEARRYKKGYEIRLVAGNKTELNQIRRLLKHAHFQVGNPYIKGSRFVQPIYGKESVEHFCRILAQARTVGLTSKDAAMTEEKLLRKKQRMLEILGAYAGKEITPPIKKAVDKLRQKNSR